VCLVVWCMLKQNNIIRRGKGVLCWPKYDSHKITAHDNVGPSSITSKIQTEWIKELQFLGLLYFKLSFWVFLIFVSEGMTNLCNIFILSIMPQNSLIQVIIFTVPVYFLKLPCFWSSSIAQCSKDLVSETGAQ
jgi:hypothetical protein